MAPRLPLPSSLLSAVARLSDCGLTHTHTRADMKVAEETPGGGGGGEGGGGGGGVDAGRVVAGRPPAAGGAM